MQRALRGVIIDRLECNSGDKIWIEKQLDYLENRHRFLTETSIGMRVKRKKKNILELKEKLLELQ